MAPSRGPFKPPKVTSSIEFEAMLENMTESSSDDDEDISLHSAKPGDSLSPRTTEAVFSHLLQEQDDEASSSAAFSPPDRDSIGPLESSLESPASSLCATGPRRLPPREAVPASPRTPGGSLLEAAAAASPRPSGGSPRSPPRGGDALSPRSPGGDGDDAFSPRSPTKNGGDAFSPRSPTKNGDDAFSPRSPTKNGEPRRRRRRRIEPGTWKIANVIGQGSFGAIYLGLNMNTGELMAVKELPIRRARDVAELRQEIDILATLEHPNIVKYLGAEVKDADDAGGPALYIMLEYVPGGSVRQLLEAFEKFSESVVRIYGNQILKGLAYLHDNAICHRDIKGANILLDEKGLVKLADFGASCNYELDACAKVQAGTPYFMAPDCRRSTSR